MRLVFRRIVVLTVAAATSWACVDWDYLSSGGSLAHDAGLDADNSAKADGPNLVESGPTSVTDADVDADAGPIANDPSLVGAWSFDQEGAKVALDSSGHGNDAQLVGNAAIQSGGLSGGGLVLSGGNDEVRVDSLGGAAFPSSGTLSLWFRYSVLEDASAGNLFDTYDSTRSHAFMRFVGSGKMQAAFQPVAPSYAWQATLVTTREAWFHVVITWDADGQHGALYLNGTLFYDHTYVSAFSPTQQQVIFGAGFQGIIDEVRLYSRALAPAEVAALP